MVALNEQADDVIDDAVLAAPHDGNTPDALRSENNPAADVSAACSNDCLLPASQARPNSSFRRVSRALVKPLIAMATAPYVIVTALVGFAAVAVAQQATHIINEKFAAITQALTRF